MTNLDLEKLAASLAPILVETIDNTLDAAVALIESGSPSEDIKTILSLTEEEVTQLLLKVLRSVKR